MIDDSNKENIQGVQQNKVQIIHLMYRDSISKKFRNISNTHVCLKNISQLAYMVPNY